MCHDCTCHISNVFVSQRCTSSQVREEAVMLTKQYYVFDWCQKSMTLDGLERPLLPLFHYMCNVYLTEPTLQILMEVEPYRADVLFLCGS